MSEEAFAHIENKSCDYINNDWEVHGFMQFESLL